jgi:two-component system sensor histidine kinase MprB
VKLPPTTSFRTRLTLLCAAGIALVLMIGSATTYLIERDRLRGQIDSSLRQDTQAHFVTSKGLGTSISLPVGPVKIRGGGAPPSITKKVSGTFVAFGTLPLYVELIDRHGRPIVPVPVRLPVSPQAIQIARTGHGTYLTDIHLRGKHLRMRVSPAPHHRALLVARSLGEVDSALSLLGWSLGITGGIGILLAALVGAVVARRALRPVRRLTATAERVAETRDLGERIPVDGSDELARLGTTFNTMLDSLDNALQSQRRLVSDASHELRTPLTSLRTNIDVLEQGSVLSEEDRRRLLRDVSGEIDELTKLVTNLVDLARGSQRALHLEQIRVDEIAADVVPRARSRFPRIDIALSAEPTVVWGDAAELDRAIWNLVENAAKWSNGGGAVQVEVASGAVVVRDRGPGVPAADLPFIFDRFYRSESARGRPGSGLGLAIVRQVAENHGGRIEVEEARGGGACFRLTLIEAA